MSISNALHRDTDGSRLRSTRAGLQASGGNASSVFLAAAREKAVSALSAWLQNEPRKEGDALAAPPYSATLRRGLRQTHDLPPSRSAGGPAADAASASASAAAELSRASHMAEAGATLEFFDTGPVDLAAVAAGNAARQATSEAVAAAQAAIANPLDVDLARAADVAGAAASDAIESATEGESSRARTHLCVARQFTRGAETFADYSNAEATGVIETAAEALDAAGANPATVAALRALPVANGQALLDANPPAVDAAFRRAAQEAQALNSPAAQAAVTAARNVRSHAFEVATSAETAATLYENTVAITHTVEGALRDAEAAPPGRLGPAIAALNHAKAAAEEASQARSNIALQQSAADAEFGLAIETGEQAGRLPPPAPPSSPTDVAAYRVQEGPAGEPGSLAIGELVVTAEAESIGNSLLRGLKAGLARAVPMLGPAIFLLAGEEFVRGLHHAVQADLTRKDPNATVTRAYLVDNLSGTAGSIAGAVLGGKGGVIASLIGGVAGFFGGRAAGRGVAASGGNSATRAIDLVIRHVIRHEVDNAFAAQRASATAAAAAAPLPGGGTIVQHGSQNDRYANAAELRDGLKAAGLDLLASATDLALLVNAYGSAGNGALTARDIDRAIADAALERDASGAVVVDPFKCSINLHAPEEHALCDNVAARLVALGSRAQGDDKQLNSGELLGALNAAGYAPIDDQNKFARLIAAYDLSGDGALDAGEIAQALKDGAMVVDTNGEVSVNDACITGLSDHTAVEIGLRVIKAGSHDDASSNSDELQDGLKEAGFDPHLSGEDRAALIAAYGDGAVLAATGIARAITDGALVIDADGKVRFDATKAH
jgi:hypothetical protein